MNLVTNQEKGGIFLSEMAPGDTFKVAGSWYMVVGSDDDFVELLDDHKIMAVRITNGNLVTFNDTKVEPANLSAVEDFEHKEVPR